MIRYDVYSPQLGHSIVVEVSLPPGYRHLRGPFPAAILNDAQNQWTNRGAYGGWHTDSTAAYLFRKGRIRPVILIGVYSPRGRDRVYAPPPDGKADRYADFLADTLLPSARGRFPVSRNPADVAVMGASYGSNVAILAGLYRPDAIGLVAGLSGAPHFGKPLTEILSERQRLPMRKLYIDCGTRWAYDQPRMDDSTAFNRNVMSLAYSRMPRGRFQGHVARGHFHNEEFWRRRVGRILQFLFGSSSQRRGG